MMSFHTLTTMTKLYVYGILCWMLLALTAHGSERDTETEQAEVMNVVTETLVEEAENGEKIELCLWKYYDRNQALCKIAVQQMNPTRTTYWLRSLWITFYRGLDNVDIEFFSVSFLGYRDLTRSAIGSDFCNEEYKPAVIRNEFVVRETMKHYMTQEHPPDRMSISIGIAPTKDLWRTGEIRFSTELQNLKPAPYSINSR